MEMKSKMGAVAAMLNERQRLSSKGTFLPISHKKIGPVNPGICQIIDRNQIQDGCRSSHLE
jgi:hypothetical protein